MAASNGFLPTGYDDAEDKPMLMMKKNGNDGHGITALINRQLQGKQEFMSAKTLNVLIIKKGNICMCVAFCVKII